MKKTLRKFFGKEDETVTFFDLSAQEKKKIVNKAVSKSNEDQKNLFQAVHEENLCKCK